MKNLWWVCVLSKEKIKIKNLLPKTHEISSTPGEITLKKDEDFDILCFEVIFDGLLPSRVRLWPINSPCTPPPISVSYSDDIGYDCQWIFLALKNDSNSLLQLYTKRKLRADNVAFYTNVDKKFYDNIDKIFIAPYPRYPYFNERIGSHFTNITCNCEKLARGKCYNVTIPGQQNQDWALF